MRRQGDGEVSRGHSTCGIGREEPNLYFKETVLKVSRDMERQQVAGYQMDLFRDYLKRARPDSAGESGTESGLVEERQVSSATDEQRALMFALTK